MIILQYIFILCTGFKIVLANNYITLHPSGEYLEVTENSSYAVACDAPEGTRVDWVNSENQSFTDKRSNDIFVERSDFKQVLLKFRNVTRRHAGIYTCLATSATQQFTRKFNLTVITPITFVDNTKVFYATEGGNATLLCEANSVPAAQITWTFNDTTLDGNGYRFLADGLFISNVTPDKFGNYTCNAYLVTNSIGSAKQHDVTLKVARTPEIVHIYPNNTVHGILNSELSLKCRVTADPSATLQWYRNKKPIGLRDYNATIQNKDNESILKIYLTSNRLLGEYTCHAKSIIGSTYVTLQASEGETPFSPTLQPRETLDKSMRFDIFQSVPQNLTNYRILFKKRDESNISDWTTTDFNINESATSPYSLNDLEPNTEYIYKAGACTAMDLCAYTEELTFKTIEKTTGSANSLTRTIITQIIILLPAFLISYYSH